MVKAVKIWNLVDYDKVEWAMNVYFDSLIETKHEDKSTFEIKKTEDYLMIYASKRRINQLTIILLEQDYDFTVVTFTNSEIDSFKSKPEKVDLTLDDLLDKLNSVGLNSFTEEEKKLLDTYSNDKKY